MVFIALHIPTLCALLETPWSSKASIVSISPGMTSVTREINRTGSARISEQTPLLRSTSAHRENATVVSGDAVTAAETEQLDEGAISRSPHLRHAESCNSDATHGEDPKDLVRFKKNGKLEGVSDWQFRCVFGGIVLGYFVSRVKAKSFSYPAGLSLRLCNMTDHHVRFHADGIKPSSHHLILSCFQLCIMALNSLSANLNIAPTAHGSAL